VIRRNLFLAIGLAALLAGATLSLIWLGEQRMPSAPGAHAPVERSVLAAARAIPAGTLVRSDDMISVSVPEQDVPADSIAPASETQFLGALVRRDFAANEPLVSSALIKKSDSSFLAAVLAPGDRAVTIAVDPTETASGLVMPGDKVDIVLTAGEGQSGRKVAQTVLSDVRIVAIDQSLSGAAAAAAPVTAYVQSHEMPRTVTLELTAQEAEKLLVAQQLGKIDLVLRPLAVSAAPSPAAVPVWSDELSPVAATRAAPAAAAPAPDAAPAAAKSIEVMHGPKIELR
jgi:pilus assembly protein CpaB